MFILVVCVLAGVAIFLGVMELELRSIPFVVIGIGMIGLGIFCALAFRQASFVVIDIADVMIDQHTRLIDDWD